MKPGITLAFDPMLFPDLREKVKQATSPIDWVTVDELRQALSSTELIAKEFCLTRFAIARAFGQDNLFEMLKTGRKIRRSRIVRLACFFGLTFDKFLGLSCQNFAENKAIIRKALSENDVLS